MARHKGDGADARRSGDDPPEGATADAGADQGVASDPTSHTTGGGEVATTGGRPGGSGTDVADRKSGRSTAMSQPTRIGAAWVAVAVAVIVLVLLLIFILQNQRQVDVTFLGATGHLPLGVLVLLAAAGGALLVIVLGAARMFQLHWLARRDLRQSQSKRRGSR